MRRRITRTFAMIALAVAVSAANAQQPKSPQRMRPPVYEAPSEQDQTEYADQYAVDENGYPVESGYDGTAPDYYDGVSQPAADSVQQVSNLSYTNRGQSGPQGGAAESDTASSGSGGRCPTGYCQNCCTPFWAHRTSFFGEWLYLRARNDGVANSLPQNGIGPGAVPAGRVNSNSPTYQPEGFRVGLNYALNRCSSLFMSYTYFHSESNGSTFANPPQVVHSLVTLPQTGTAASDGVAALSHYDIHFQFADAEYRRLLAGGTNWYLNYSIGARYANLYQQFSQAQLNGPTQTGVTSNIGMDAAGGRVGLLAARKAANRGFYFYGSAFANILAGNFRANYMQVNNLSGVQGRALWQSYRPVPILEYELGAGWISPNGKWSFSAGYYFAAWFNVISPSTYINAVQNNNYGPLNTANNITFDGLVVRGQRMF